MFCEPCDVITTGWPNVVKSDAPRLSICSGRDACPRRLVQTPCGATSDEGQDDGDEHRRARPAPTQPRRAATPRRARAARARAARASRRPPRRAAPSRAGRGRRAAQRAPPSRAAPARGRSGERISEPDQERRDRDVERGRRPDTSDHERRARRRRPPSARRTSRRSRPKSDGSDEHRQRARRVVDGEVAVRDEAVVHDRVAVALVGRRVDELAVRPEPPVDEPQADEERRRRRRAASAESRNRRVNGLVLASVVLARCGVLPAAARSAPSRRTGRTTAGRGRTSASARARSRRARRR